MLGPAALAQEKRHSVTLSIAGETAGMDGRAWDSRFPNAKTFDAIHRALLVRFPGLTQALQPHVKSGYAIVTAHVALDYDGYEIAPEGYLVRHGLGEGKWKADPPRWHVLGWVLRQAWTSDPRVGPTFNASAHGARYWMRYGASDTARDRYPLRLGPVELSHVERTARFDVTALLAGRELSHALAEGVRILRDQGLLLKKLETYDSRYRDAGDPYEWAMPTGGHGLTIRNPRLEITLSGSRASRDAELSDASLPAPLPPGSPTASLPSRAEFEAMARRSAARLHERAEWQRERIAELLRIGGGRAGAWARAMEGRDFKSYSALVREILATPLRYWQGWDIHDDLLIWHQYRALLPAYVQDHVKAYWASWLMPEMPTSALVHPQSAAAVDYWRKSGDWRGKASFFRDGYNYSTSTQNFNHTAAMGALLGGTIIDSRHAIDDGRHGLEHYPLRLWTVRDGTMQEMLDHYYLSITLSAQKMFADYGPLPIDRLMGRVMVDRTVDLLASAYHPRLRRIVSSSGRARISGLLLEQDGIYGVLHSLSRKGVLNHLKQPLNARVHGLPVWGEDVPPGRIAVQAMASPWAAEWMAHTIDDKALPFEETAADTMRGAFDPPLWRRTYLGRQYALASQDLRGGTADVVAQWTRTGSVVQRPEDLGTLTLRYVLNTPDLATTSGGAMPNAGSVATFQHRNRAIVCTRPHADRAHLEALAGKAGIRSLASVVALWNFRPDPDWEIRIDGRAVTSLPATAKAGQHITIRDGLTYLGIIALPAADLGRSDEVVIGFGGGKSEPNGAPLAPALTIASYNLQSPDRVPALDWDRVRRETYGGFVIELGDATEHGDFASFVRHMRAGVTSARWSAREKRVHVMHRSGRDRMEMGCGTDYEQPQAHYPVKPGDHLKAIAYRRINGRWPYLARGIDRDTPLAQSGTSGTLSKNGATLTTAPGRKAFLQTEPAQGIYVGYNPLPDPTPWSLTTPGGTLTADGKVGLLKVTVRSRENRIEIDYAPKHDQRGSGTGRHLLAQGFEAPPHVEVNGVALSRALDRVRSRGASAYAIPIVP